MPEHGNKDGRAAPPLLLCTFGALCIFLSALEYALPKPFPFLRIGLANFPVMLALFWNARSFAALIAIKSLGGALITGTLFSYALLFSIAGSASSAFFMWLLWRLCGLRRAQYGGSCLSFAGLGIAGAFVSNITQIALARFLVLGRGAFYIAPPFIAAGIITGCTLGIFCNRFAGISRWYGIIRSGCRQILPDRVQHPNNADTKSRHKKKITLCRHITSTRIIFFFGLLASIAVLCTANIVIKCIEFGIILSVFIYSKKKNNYFITGMFIIMITACNVLFPFGKVLWTFGRFTLTSGALTEGFNRALTVEALVFLSRLCVSKNLMFPGFWGHILGETFTVLAALNSRKNELKLTCLAVSLDNLLLSISKLDTYSYIPRNGAVQEELPNDRI
ncbi:MAG: Gx transporter family protein [Spirochaetaceae bacterium]|jgi:heptaprenyl diphosphate synthase|nr:Gx transporter family protein [Spirochaetaceae bacterium]